MNHLHFCMSNPCFELWLLLHLEDISKYDEETTECLRLNRKKKSGTTWLKQRMRDLLGSYSESSFDAYSLLPNVSHAMDRARQLDSKAADRWPQTIGTRVYLLMESIMGEKMGSIKP